MPSLRTAHVLIVDDERDIAEMLQSLLERHGFSAQIAESGEEALKLLDEWSFAAIITDHYLGCGELCGLDLVEAVQQRGRAIPFLVVTACIEDEILDSLRDHPAVRELFRKPFDLMALLKRVSDLVEAGRALRTASPPDGIDAKTSSSRGLSG